MARWTRGEADIEAFISQRQLEQIRGTATDGRPVLQEARTRLGTAQAVTGDVNGAFIMAYDAARLACISLLAQQGLRATREGGHLVVEKAMRAQFSPGFRDFGWMRRRRNEVEYPSTADSAVSTDELSEALIAAASMVDVANQLLPRLGPFLK